MEGKRIPGPMIALLSDYISANETHASMDSLFLYADAPGEPPEGSKAVKAQEWLRRVNKESVFPLATLGRLIEGYMEAEITSQEVDWFTGSVNPSREQVFQDKAKAVLSKYGLTYLVGGIISEGGGPVSKSLADVIHGRDIPALELEFERALKNIENSPRESVSAACNILETLFKVYIHDEGLVMPSKMDLQSVWKVVREEMGFNASLVEDNDLKKIISGVFSTVDGIGSLRSHASSAHGQGRNAYKLKPRHARLAVNSAHTLALFFIESWDDRS